MLAAEWAGCGTYLCRGLGLPSPFYHLASKKVVAGERVPELKVFQSPHTSSLRISEEPERVVRVPAGLWLPGKCEQESLVCAFMLLAESTDLWGLHRGFDHPPGTPSLTERLPASGLGYQAWQMSDPDPRSEQAAWEHGPPTPAACPWSRASAQEGGMVPALGSAAQGPIRDGLSAPWWSSVMLIQAYPPSPVAGGWEEHREQPASSRLIQGLSWSFRLLGTNRAPLPGSLEPSG